VTHTPEPWEANVEGVADVFAGDLLIAECTFHQGELSDEAIAANAARIAACVNAMAGIDDPAAIMSELVGLRTERDALLRFKQYVHARLDAAGVPSDPESPHKAEGCRVGGRLDWLLSSRADLLAAMHRLACRGNGDRWGNSTGNQIAQDAILKAAAQPDRASRETEGCNAGAAGNAVATPPGPAFESSDAAYLRGLADRMEQGFYSVNPRWVRDLAARVEGTLGRLDRLPGSDAGLPRELIDFHDHAIDQDWHGCDGIPGGCPVAAAMAKAKGGAA
jgi:hypothetical protein